MAFMSVGTLRALPGRRDEVVAILTDPSADLKAHGCVQYDVGLDDESADVIHVVEKWDSAASHAASLQLPAVRDASARAMPMLSPEMAGSRFEVVGSPLSPTWTSHSADE